MSRERPGADCTSAIRIRARSVTWCWTATAGRACRTRRPAHRRPRRGTRPCGSRWRPQMDSKDLAAVTAQLGREPRGVRGVAHRCPCGLPDVIETAPYLPDGSPFPTLYYLTCPKAASAIGTLEE